MVPISDCNIKNKHKLHDLLVLPSTNIISEKLEELIFMGIYIYFVKKK